MKWSEISPLTHPYEQAAVAKIIRPIIMAEASHLSDDRQAMEDRLAAKFIQTLGPWVAGWHWSASEVGGGGPIQFYCCAEHSLFPPEESDPAQTVERILSAINDWRDFLVEISRCFAENQKQIQGGLSGESIQVMAATLLPLIVRRTSAEDAWYNTFSQTILWFIESCGHASETFESEIVELVSGRFSSWTPPSEAEAHQVCQALGQVMEPLLASQRVTPIDALDRWLQYREMPRPEFTLRPRTPWLASGDAHRHYIETHDRVRDPQRADRLLTALDMVRASARNGEPMTFERLATVQSVVLGFPVGFRQGPAFAKNGRELYSFHSQTADQFFQALSQIKDTAVPLAWRVARAYLDVCFFHPFPDGNARAARLLVDYMLTRENGSLLAAEPVFGMQLAIQPDLFKNFYQTFHELIERLT